MTPREIYGRLMIAGSDAKSLALRVGCDDSMVRKVIRGDRLSLREDSVGRKVRLEVAEVLGLAESEVWPSARKAA